MNYFGLFVGTVQAVFVIWTINLFAPAHPTDTQYFVLVFLGVATVFNFICSWPWEE